MAYPHPFSRGVAANSSCAMSRYCLKLRPPSRDYVARICELDFDWHLNPQLLRCGLLICRPQMRAPQDLIRSDPTVEFRWPRESRQPERIKTDEGHAIAAHLQRFVRRRTHVRAQFITQSGSKF